MIEITRSLARQLRAVLRKALPRHATQIAHSPLVLRVDSDGLRIQHNQGDIAVEYHCAGAYKADTLAIPSEALADFEGRKNETVTLSHVDGGVQARWFDVAVPRSMEYSGGDTEKMPDFPDMPDTWSDPGANFVKALADAFSCTSRHAVRYALTHLQFRGSKGEINATDGRQLLTQTGFKFPWKEDLLVPAIAVFGSRELPLDDAVTIGKTETCVGIRLGPWTFLLAIDKQRRYPDATSVIPSPNKAATTWKLPADDAAFLAGTLPRLPGGRDDEAPVTVDLNGHAAIRVRPEGEKQVTEVVLSRAEISGPPVRFRSNRCFLERALDLGFGEFRVVSADTPVVGGDGRRQYVWMLLDKARGIPPTDDAIRITSADVFPVSHPQSKQERRRASVKTSPSNGSPVGEERPIRKKSNDGAKAAGTTVAAVIEESNALKEILRDAFHRVQRLGGALKRHRQQSKTMQAALTSLKQLQQIDA